MLWVCICISGREVVCTMALLLSKIWVSFCSTLWCPPRYTSIWRYAYRLNVSSMLSLFQGFTWLTFGSFFLGKMAINHQRGCFFATNRHSTDLLTFGIRLFGWCRIAAVWPWNRQRSTHLLMHLRPPHDDNLHSRLCSSRQMEFCNLKTDDLWGWILQITIVRQKPSIFLPNLMYCSSNFLSLFSSIEGLIIQSKQVISDVTTLYQLKSVLNLVLLKTFETVRAASVVRKSIDVSANLPTCSSQKIRSAHLRKCISPASDSDCVAETFSFPPECDVWNP